MMIGVSHHVIIRIQNHRMIATMFRAIIVISLQLLAVSCMPQIEDTEKEASSPDTQLYEQLFKFRAESSGSVDKKLEFLAKVKAKYSKDSSYEDLIAYDVTYPDIQTGCDRDQMKLQLALAVMVHNEHPELTTELRDKFMDQITKCLHVWFRDPEDINGFVDALMRSMYESRDGSHNWKPMTKSSVKDALSRLGFTAYGNAYLYRNFNESIEQMKERFEFELLNNLPLACRSFDDDWHIIGRAWMVLAMYSDNIQINSEKFKKFIETFDACSIVTDDPVLIQFTLLAKYKYLYEQLYSPQDRLTLPPTQAKSALELMHLYCRLNNISIPNEEDNYDLMNIIEKGAYIDSHHVTILHQLENTSNNRNIVELVKYLYDSYVPALFSTTRANFIRAIEVHSNSIKQLDLKHLDQLVELVLKYKQDLGHSYNKEFIDQIEEQVFHKALAEYYSSKQKKSILGCIGGKSQRLTPEKVKETFGDVCYSLGGPSITYYLRLSEILRTDEELVKQYSEMATNLMLWMRRVAVCQKIKFDQIKYDQVNEYMTECGSK